MSFARYLAKKYYSQQVRREEKTHLGQWMILYRWQDRALANDFSEMRSMNYQLFVILFVLRSLVYALLMCILVMVRKTRLPKQRL